MSEAIKVVVRIRPMNQKQKDRGCSAIVYADEDNKQISINKPGESEANKVFAYDSVFAENVQQNVVYEKTAFALVENVITGYNGTIFAYGQTGCGKTHSMVGRIDIEELQGIIPRSFGHILETISEAKHKQFLIRCSFIEIYNQEVRDLLGKDVKKSLEIKESPDKGVFIKDLSSNPAKTQEELMEYMNIGNKNRSVGETAMNKDSSRSHLLFMLYLESADVTDSEDKKYVGSKLNLVDLAGSERINKTGAQGDRLQQAKNINLSLSALGNVISALVDGKSHHIPYRDSKLTRLLQDSLGGNTKTVMIANCSPADYNFDETMSTLRYASRAKFIKNKPIINEDPKDALLKEYTLEIKKLKELLAKRGEGSHINSDDNFSEIVSDKLKRKQVELNSEKEEKKLLMQKIRQLEHQHLSAGEVCIDSKLRQSIQKVRKSLVTPEVMKELKITDMDEITFKKLVPPKADQQNYKEYIKQLKKEISGLETQIKDIYHENYLDKQTILDDLRDLSKQNKFLQGFLNILLSPAELEVIRASAEKTYNLQTKQFNIPHFQLKIKDVILPKLIENQPKLIENQPKLIENQPKLIENQSIEIMHEFPKNKEPKRNHHEKRKSSEKIKMKQNSSLVVSQQKNHQEPKKIVGKLSPIASKQNIHDTVIRQYRSSKREQSIENNFKQNFRKQLDPINRNNCI